MINLTQQKKLQRTQNKCVRLIDTGHDMAEIRKKYNILNINELTTLENYKIWYREQENCLPENLLKQMREDHLRQTVVVEIVMTSWSGHASLGVRMCCRICSVVISPCLVTTCCAGCIGCKLASWGRSCSLDY